LIVDAQSVKNADSAEQKGKVSGIKRHIGVDTQGLPHPLPLPPPNHGSPARLWKLELQRLANELHMAIHVCHFPPGTSKWNKIEHRLVSDISMNWRGQDWVSHEVIVNLIAANTTRKGLKVLARSISAQYQTGAKVTDAKFNAIQLTRDTCHGECNYVTSPT
jgi:hypothetical protein